MIEEVVILSACRTPIGSFCGGISTLKAHELGSIVIKESLSRAKVDPSEVSEVFLGQILSAGQGQNPARQASINGGLPCTVPATQVNMVCGSGLRSVVMGAQAIKLGDAQVVVAGGQESMSQSHHSILMRNGVKMGDANLSDTMIVDGLTDAFNKYHMGITAENVAKKFNVTREEQDQFAVNSQMKTAEAQKNGHFNEEIVPVEVVGRKGVTKIEKDEFPKNDSTIEGLSKLRSAFIRDSTGTVTAGNASGINDGAAAVVLTSSSWASSKNITPLAKIVSYSSTGIDPAIMGVAPISAVKMAVKKAGWELEEVDLFELNEAFAAQSLAVVKELQINPKKVNIWGGAIALGHPIGASGSRILVTLIHALKKTGGKKGVASLCIGGGMGIAICIEML